MIYRDYNCNTDSEYEYERDDDWNGLYKHVAELKYCKPLKQNYNDDDDSIADTNFDMPLFINNETDLNINKTNNNMNELNININSDETTYINDSEHYKSENNICSENYICSENNNIDSENKLNNKLNNNKNLKNKISSYINMSKARLRNLQNLNTLATKIKDENIKDKIKDILSFYESKKISQFTTAKNLIKSFTSKDEKKIKKAEENFKKHQEAKPIDERMKEKYTRVERKNMDKPQSSIKFKISQKTPDFSEALITLKKIYYRNEYYIQYTT